MAGIGATGLLAACGESSPGEPAADPTTATSTTAAPAAGAPRPVPFRGGGFQPSGRAWAGPLLFVLLIGIWEWGSASGWITPLTLPRPSAVAAVSMSVRVCTISGRLWEHLGPSLGRLAVGSALGLAAGIGVGLMIGLFSLARAGLAPLVAALFPVPKIALLPLFVIWFGIDEASKYALIAFGAALQDCRLDSEIPRTYFRDTSLALGSTEAVG